MINAKDFEELMNMFTPDEVARMAERATAMARARSAKMPKEERLSDARSHMYTYLADSGLQLISEAAGAIQASLDMGLIDSEAEGWELVAAVQNIWYRQYEVCHAHPELMHEPPEKMDAMYEKMYGISLKDDVEGRAKHD